MIPIEAVTVSILIFFALAGISALPWILTRPANRRSRH